METFYSRQEIIQIAHAIDAAQSDQERKQIIDDNLEILARESIAQVRELEREAREAEQQEDAKFWAHMGMFLYNNSAQLFLRLEEQRSNEFVPSPQTRWAKLLREYFPRQEEELLLQAIAAATANASDDGVLIILQALARKDIEVMVEQGLPLFDSLREREHSEEAYTVALAILFLQGSLTDSFALYPLTEQENALKTGIEAAEEAVICARILRDESCEAFFLKVFGNGLRNGNRLEGAETALRESLALYERLFQQNPEAYEPELAAIQINLGFLLSDLGQLEAAETALHQALGHYERLFAQNPETYAPELAQSRSNLAVLWSKWGRLEDAETALYQALDFYETLDERPQTYAHEIAMGQNNLGSVLHILGKLEASESAYYKALALFEVLAQKRPEMYKPKLALLQRNLSALLNDSGQLKGAEKAIRKALALYGPLVLQQPDMYAHEVATAHNSLGTVLRSLGHLRDAEVAFRQALATRQRLSIQRPDVYEPEVAKTQSNLGAVLLDLGQLEAAEAALKEALAIRQRLFQQRPEVYASEVARTQSNLATVLNSTGQVEAAESAYREALALYSHRYDASNKIRTIQGLSHLLMGQSKWKEAQEVLSEAVTLIETTYSEASSLSYQRHILEGNVAVYENLFTCLIQMKQFDKALEISEQSKSRTLIDLMATKDMQPRDTPVELVEEYKQVLAQIRSLQNDSIRAVPNRDLDKSKSSSFPPTMEREYRRYEELVQKIHRYDPNFLPRAQTLTHQQILDVAHNADSTLVIFHVTVNGTFIFLVYPDGQSEVVEARAFKLSHLNNLIAHLENDKVTSGWLLAYNNYLQHRDGLSLDKWQSMMTSTLETLEKELMAPIRDKLQSRGVTDLIFVPNRALAIFPLHACYWTKETTEGKCPIYWIDEYTIRYAPTLFILKRCLAQESRFDQRVATDTLLGVINPQQDLPASMWEGAEIERLLGEEHCQILWEQQGTRIAFDNALKNQSLVHFSCHGSYNPATPLESSLWLAQGSRLSLCDIFQRLNMPSVRLVVLSACETSLVDWLDAADETYGLSTGFLYAGVPTVFASLWAVGDGSTALLMTHVYELLKGGRDKKDALRESQRWLRNLTAAEALACLPDSPHADILRVQLQRTRADKRFFANPFWWAAFQCVGV